jgi:hypothetical protein
MERSGREERNEFFNTVLDNLSKLSGQPVPIRIGANSEVRSDFLVLLLLLNVVVTGQHQLQSGY